MTKQKFHGFAMGICKLENLTVTGKTHKKKAEIEEKTHGRQTA